MTDYVSVPSWVKGGPSPDFIMFYPVRVRMFLEHFFHIPAQLTGMYEEAYQRKFNELPDRSTYTWAGIDHAGGVGIALSAPVPKGFKMTTEDKYLVKSFTNGSVPGTLGWRGSDYVSIEAGKFINKQANEGWTLVSLQVPDYRLATVVMERAPRQGFR